MIRLSVTREYEVGRPTGWSLMPQRYDGASGAWRQAGTVPVVRHLRSIIYALVLAPAVWILCGVGFDQDLTGRARDNGGIESLSGVLLLLLAGAAYAILLFAPISPAGPALAGLVFAVVGAWARLAPESYAAVW